MANFKRPTTIDLIANGKYPNAPAGTIIETLGYTTKGDGGGAAWKKTGVTGLTVSQSPALLVDGKLTDANGHEWELDAEGHISARVCGAVVNGATDDVLALNAAVAFLYRKGGGTLFLDAIAAISATLVIPQRVIVEGPAGFFANQFTNLLARPAGAGLFMLTGSNVDVVQLKLDVYVDGTDIKETGNDQINNDYRYFGGLRNLVIYGNRSTTANPPTTVDNNTLGRGVAALGVRYPIIDNVVIMYCAEEGAETASFDYGLGAISPNNLLFNDIASLSNAGQGFSLSGGDAIVRGLIAGYNGLTGISASLSRSRVEFQSWNNKVDGIFITGAEHSEYQGHAYDNDRGGWRLTTTKSVTCRGRSSANGRDSGTHAATDRVGVLSSADNEDLHLDIEDDGSYLTVAYQEYGFRILNTTNVVNFGVSSSTGNNTANFLLTDPTSLNLHGTLVQGGAHPGFDLQGTIDLNGNPLTGFLLREHPDTSGQTAILTTPTALVNVGTAGAIYYVSVAHTGGNAGARAVVLGDTVTPVIITQDSGGSDTYTFTISGTSLRVNTGAGTLTSNWTVIRTL